MSFACDHKLTPEQVVHVSVTLHQSTYTQWHAPRSIHDQRSHAHTPQSSSSGKHCLWQSSLISPVIHGSPCIIYSIFCVQSSLTRAKALAQKGPASFVTHKRKFKFLPFLVPVLWQRQRRCVKPFNGFYGTVFCRRIRWMMHRRLTI